VQRLKECWIGVELIQYLRLQVEAVDVGLVV
jgi:hypothetical protein